ncbi:reverse transcriptase domain-containing protein [Tanacetum coccineum]
MVSGPEEQPISVNKVKEERVKVAINPEHLEQTVMIGSDLTEKARIELSEYRLNVRKGCQSVRQKKRGQAAKRNIAINDEVSKLVAARIMREVHYHDWLSNPVMVKKSDNSWRMCVDFKDLNKACPKDGYPLPEIDWKAHGSDVWDLHKQTMSYEKYMRAHVGTYKSMPGMPSAQTYPKKSAGKFESDHISVAGFGLPGEIISDNGKQFRDNPFKDWCEKLCIQQHFASVKHPQTNGLVERANRSLGEGIKARLGKDNKNWMEEIYHVLWVHRTMVKSGNGDTSFSLTYGTEAVIPVEIEMPTFKTSELDMAKNDEALQINLELLEEKREQAAITEAKSKRQMEKYYNAKVRNTSFKPGDLVYRNNEASRAEDTGKLGPKWEGPYEVTEALGKGSYRLKDRNGKELPRTWNVSNLKKCYVHKM